MSKKNFTLTPRTEGVRDKNNVAPAVVISYDLEAIKQHFDDSLDSIKQQFAVAELLSEAEQKESCQNIWRSQIVFVESILDFYIHELSKYATVAMFTNQWKKSERYKNFLIPVKEVEKMLKDLESTQWLIEFVNEKLSRDVYLGFEQMRDQINFMGLNFQDILKNTFSEEKNPAQAGKEFIIDIFKRRNQIAHQLDRGHSDAKQQNITKEYVEICIKNIENLVENIHNEARKKNK